MSQSLGHASVYVVPPYSGKLCLLRRLEMDTINQLITSFILALLAAATNFLHIVTMEVFK